MSTLAPAPSERLLPGQRFIPDLVEVQGPHRLRFARTEGDLDRIQRLRFQVFNLELGEGFAESYTTGRDQDAFDHQCQHVLVETVAGGDIVGTYRLQVAENALAGAGFYSATEFDFGTMPAEVLRSSVELGRACVSKEHRSKRALFLLWRGLIEYSLHNGKTAFFGCSSLTSQDPAEGLRFYEALRARGRVHPTVRVEPLPANACVCAGSIEGPPVPVPTLFGIYLRHGGTVLGPPALDREFGTIDYLTYIAVDRTHIKAFGGRRR